MPRWTLPATALAITAAAAALLTGCGKGGHADPLPSVRPSPTPTPSSPSFLQATNLRSISQPNAVRVGPNNTIWFTDRGENAIGTMTAQPNSVVKWISAPAGTPAQLSPYDAPSGVFWFTEFNSSGGDIVKLTPKGQITQVNALNLQSGETPRSIIVAPRNAPSAGMVWVDVAGTAGGDALYRYDPAATDPSKAVVDMPYPVTPNGTFDKTRRLTFDKNGNLWMTERTNSDLIEISQTGTPTVERRLPLVGYGGMTQPNDIALGPDGNLWIGDFLDVVYRVNPTTLSFTVFTISENSFCGSTTIAPAASGNSLWFSDYRCNAIGQVTTTGQVTEFFSPLGSGRPNAIAVNGQDGSVWYSDQGLNQLVRMALP